MNWLAMAIGVWLVLGILGAHFQYAILPARDEIPLPPLFALSGPIAFIVSIVIAAEK